MKRLYWCLIALFLLVMGCSGGADSHEETVISRLEHETANEEIDLNIAALLVEIGRVDVTAEGGEPFHTAERTTQIIQYPCSSCHEVGVELADTLGEPHWQVTLNHAGPEVMTCTTCHQPDNFDVLQSLSGSVIDFDNSYQLCAQCHSNQFDDWVGGAHGKRLEGWAPPRIVENCVGCHNPHQPGFEQRWPAVIGEGSQE